MAALKQWFLLDSAMASGKPALRGPHHIQITLEYLAPLFASRR